MITDIGGATSMGSDSSGRHGMESLSEAPGICLHARYVVGVAALMIVGLAACGSDNGGGGGAATSSVSVTEREWGVVPDPTSADAGEVTFSVSNEGTEIHEFVVVKTDLASGDLPTVEDGSVDEEGEGIEPVDEIEDIAASSSQELKVDLESGHYIVFCNIVEKENGETVSHYANGMRTDFTVN
ncbi:MAG TPA: hypothetical protein VFF07_04285 [Actinomycetota bacterium]|nr:hypothetical protein [Actinomycetota bacterium]